ncbi:MAG: NAD-dependent deacylase [Deltaproteobacteria bacterium]|nr:NAD-dependent deacylase [Deltaproteobacteria bacterium]
MEREAGIERARAWISEAGSVAVLTGAGVSAESGVPTFRGPGGLWREHRPEDLATPEAFARDPLLVWEWYAYRRELIAACRPNPAHEALVRLEKRCEDMSLITQNVDGLHALAGSRRVLELHGNLFAIRCCNCGAERQQREPPASLPPRCARCGGLERPGVVWFGEALPGQALESALAAVRRAELVLVVGTSGVVWPAAGLLQAAPDGCRSVLVNLEPTDQSEQVDLALHGKAGEILPGIVAA